MPTAGMLSFCKKVVWLIRAPVAVNSTPLLAAPAQARQDVPAQHRRAAARAGAAALYALLVASNRMHPQSTWFLIRKPSAASSSRSS